MIIDTHTHLGTLHEGHKFTADDLVADMEKGGVDFALVFALEFSQQDGIITTEELIETTRTHKNLFPIGTVSPTSFTQERQTQIESLLKSDALKGIKLYLGYEHFYPNDERLTPLYEMCSKYGKPIIYHTGFFWDPGKRGLIKYAHPLGVDDVATQFPDLKIVIAHIGNPWITDCAVVAQKNDNVYVDVSGYFVEFQPIQKEEVKHFIEDIKKFYKLTGNYRKLLFASDWPLYSLKEYKEYVDAAKLLPLSNEDKEWFFWKNAAMIFNLPIIRD